MLDKGGKPDKESRYHKGIFKPSFPKKYIGNAKCIIYRSSWERRFMRYCDTNESIIKWSSEEIAIRYFNPVKKRVARYFPDFYIECIDKQNNKKKTLIEIKPFKETKPPKPGRRTKNQLIREALFVQNKAKWRAAEEFCLDNGWEWQVITEKELGIYNA